MKKIITLSLAAIALFCIQSVKAQVVYEKMYFQEENMKGDSYLALLKDVIGLPAEVKFSLKMKNTSKNFLIYDPTQSSFKIDGNKVPVEEKQKALAPGKSKMWTINGGYPKMNKTKEFDFVFDGLVEVKQSEKSEVVPELKLPLSKNDFTFGAVNVKVKNLIKETNKTEMKLEITNDTKSYLVMYPSRVAAKMPDGNTYACDNKKSKPELIAPGESATVKIKFARMPGGSKNDMQIREMLIQWEDVFFMGDPVKIDSQTIHFEWDEALTEGKN